MRAARGLGMTLVVLCLGCAGEPPSGAAGPEPLASSGPAVESPDRSPEAALRELLLAIANGNADSIRKRCLPNDSLDLLVGTQRPTPDQVRQMEEAFSAMPIQQLRPGDSFTLPDGRELQIQDSMVGEGRAMLTFPGNPVPISAQLQNGVWLIDAEPFLAGRRAANASQQQD